MYNKKLWKSKFNILILFLPYSIISLFHLNFIIFWLDFIQALQQLKKSYSRSAFLSENIEIQHNLRQKKYLSKSLFIIIIKWSNSRKSNNSSRNINKLRKIFTQSRNSCYRPMLQNCQSLFVRAQVQSSINKLEITVRKVFEQFLNFIDIFHLFYFH